MNLKNKLEIVATLGVMDLKLKYRSSKLGFLWSFLKPLLQFTAYYIVFALVLKIGKGAAYPLTLFLGVLMWSFFTEGTSLGLNSYLGKKAVVTKINVDKILIPVAAYVTPAMNFILNMTIFICIYIAASLNDSIFEQITICNICMALLSFIDIGVIIIALNIILANLNALFRDIQNIWELFLQYGVFITPIIYPLPVPDKYLTLYFFANVVAYPIELMKKQFFIYDTKIFNDGVLFAHIASVSILCLIACCVHKKISYKVADYL